jgi:hypothetical protein
VKSFNGIRVAKLSMLCVAPVVVVNPFVAAKAELHPIVDVQSGYLFGATADGKWIKAEEAAKLLPAEATYRVYGVTQALGEAKGGKPHKVSIQLGISAGVLETN